MAPCSLRFARLRLSPFVVHRPSHKSRKSHSHPSTLQPRLWSVQTPPSARIQTLNSPLCARRPTPPVSIPCPALDPANGPIIRHGQSSQVRGRRDHGTIHQSSLIKMVQDWMGQANAGRVQTFILWPLRFTFSICSNPPCCAGGSISFPSFH
jgi:hypothetical protein